MYSNVQLALFSNFRKILAEDLKTQNTDILTASDCRQRPTYKKQKKSISQDELRKLQYGELLRPFYSRFVPFSLLFFGNDFLFSFLSSQMQIIGILEPTRKIASRKYEM
jgi:hypothetical protein